MLIKHKKVGHEKANSNKPLVQLKLSLVSGPEKVTQNEGILSVSVSFSHANLAKIFFISSYSLRLKKFAA